MQKKGANDLTVQIQNSTDPTCMRVIMEIPRIMESYDITISKEHELDFLKVIDAMFDLGFFIHKDGTPATKVGVFRIIGKITGIDIENVNQRLNYAYRAITCTRIFKLMKTLVEKKYNS